MFPASGLLHLIMTTIAMALGLEHATSFAWEQLGMILFALVISEHCENTCWIADLPDQPPLLSVESTRHLV